MSTVVVLHLIAGTVCTDTWTADVITTQKWRRGRALISLYRGGRLAEQITYRRAERIHRILEPREPA